MKFNEYDKLDLPKIAEEILADWKENETFLKSIKSKEGKPEFIFYEGQPSANGLPGIHNVMALSLIHI